ncbi:MAG: DUF1641 domain-containing protein [Desulfurococcales archaeon]|nr:DUF1641 domain-containing protein [Desulfurococcales archaeon]
MSEQEKILLDEESLKALEALIETAVKMKESGLLDALRVIAEKSSEIFAYVANEVPLHRFAALGDAATTAIGRLKPEEVISLKFTMEQASECLFKSLASTKVENIQPVSTFGLLRVLGDKDVQVGLGFLIAIAKNLGACIRQKIEKK